MAKGMNMMVYENMVGAVLFSAVLSLSASTDVHVGFGEAFETNVLSGRVEHEGRIVVSDGGSVHKTGAGTWGLASSAIAQPNAAALKVAGGTLELTVDDVSCNVATTQAPEATARACLWIDASLYATQPALFSTATSNGTVHVDRCLDVRETSPAAPTRPYVQSNVYTNHVGASPQLRAFGDKTAFWFGGYGSGLFFDWMKTGSLESIRYCHAFFMHRVDASFGFIAGTGLHISGWGSAVSSTNQPAWNSLYERAVQSGRVYLDGELFDGFVKRMPTGTHLLDIDLGEDSIVSDAFFRDRGLFDASVGYRAGGDWLCEAIVFTNRLTEAERLEISAYLLDKWKGAGPTAKHFATGADGTVTISARETNTAELSFSGAGTVVKTGTATPVLGGSDANVFDGVLSVQEGKVDTRGAFAVSVAVGDRVTAAAGSSAGTLVSVAHDAGSGRLVKDGTGEAFVRAMPTGLKTLDVSAGTLTILPAATNTATSTGGETVVAIPNAGFEEWDDADVQNGVFDKLLTSSTAYHGWYGTDGTYASVYDYVRWTPATAKGTEASRQTFGLTCPPEGSSALFIHHAYRPGHPYARGGVAAWTYVDIPASGIYEFSCRVSGRAATSSSPGNYIGTPADILLIDEATTPYTTNRLGRVRYCTFPGWRRFVLRGNVVGSGRHQLRLQSLSDGDRSLTFDDLALRRVLDPKPEAWPIPGGTFEDAVFERTDGTTYNQWSEWNFHYRTFCTTNSAPGWEFIQPSGWTEGSVPYVGVSTYLMNGAAKYNNSRGEYGGIVELFFNGTSDASGAAARTTFTPPAGTHYLQADVSRFEGGGTLTASLSIAGGTISLGTISFDNRMFKAVRWPVAFTADGSQAATLTVTYNSTSTQTGGAWIDNVALYPATGRELEFVSNGSFEQTTGTAPNGWTSALVTGNFQCNDYGPNPSHFGTDTVDGTKYLLLGNMRCTTQQLNLPVAGCYRLTWYAHSRLTTSCRDNSTRVWIGFPDGTTNVLATTWNASSNFVQHACVFSVPAAGSYTLGIAGTQTTGSWYPAYEVLIDGVSVRPVATELPTQVFQRDMRVTVAADAHLNLAFAGTNVVSALVLGGESCHGVVDAKSHPDFISGSGAFQVVPNGTLMVFR